MESDASAFGIADFSEDTAIDDSVEETEQIQDSETEDFDKTIVDDFSVEEPLVNDNVFEDEAFENAGLAIFNIISDTSGIDSKIAKSFEITSEDEVSLLYDYLEELLFYHEVEFMLFSEFIIEIEKTDDDYHLKAIINGEDINWDKHERDCEIKAITFHQMEVNISDDVRLKAIVDL